jgi:uncharacterized membrane protein
MAPNEPAADEDRDSLASPRWPSIAGTSLSVIGLALAGYLTYEHYTSSTSLSCPAGGGIIDCLKVTASPYSKVHGIPVTVLGLVFFAVMIGVQSRPAWASSSPAVRISRFLWSLVGVGTAAWLIYVELFRLNAVCLWCSAVHIISLLLFVVTAFGTAAMAGSPAADSDSESDLIPAQRRS